ncbi:hypothetical protein FACS189449_12140 [Alphaproteobacteria bacterium]|nr:hypothetical protein FACS189449_12140 [Alphaproteobacteria bacterium]
MDRYSYVYGGVIIFLLSACERSGLSPVELKIDNNNAPVSSTAVDTSSSPTHRVREGETLYDIAYRYNVDPMNLAKINGIKAPYRVRKGQLLYLPKDGQVSDTSESAVVVTEDKSVRSYEEDENIESKNTGCTESKKKDRLDEELAGVLDDTTPPPPSTPTVAADAPSKQTAEELSKPKVVEDASGVPKKETPADGKLVWPVKGKVISEFGDITDGVSNDGINIRAKKGTDVKAASAGVVIYAGNKYEEEFGNIIAIKHSNGLVTSYAHLKDVKVKEEDSINAGDVIGTVGDSGDVSEPQLHFEVMKNKNPVNPRKFLK